MLKHFLTIALISAMFAGCVNNNAEENTSNEPVVVQVADFTTKAGENVGQMVMVTGTVAHVCQHGGKRMFLISQDSEDRVKVVTGDNMASFNTNLEGDDVKVTGTVDELRIDEDYLAEWEAELMMDEETRMKETSDGSGHEGSEKGEEADQGEHIAGMEQIANYRQEMKDKAVDHLSFYSIIATDYEVVDEEMVDEPETENM